MKITIVLQQHDLKNHAMVASGLDPRALGMKPGIRVHANRKKNAARGLCKHRARRFD